LVSQLKAQGYEAIFVRWAYRRDRFECRWADLDGLIKAIDYLININNGYRQPWKVLVIGGGFVAFDAARLAFALARGFLIASSRSTPYGDGCGTICS
jgi:NADPH-dependent glutamate synthase beta subunit-like oxidoreductase